MIVPASTRRESTIVCIFIILLIGLGVIGDRTLNPSPLCPRPTYVQQLEAIVLQHDFDRLARFPHPGDVEGSELLPVQWQPYSMCLLDYSMRFRESRGFGSAVYMERRFSLPYRSASRVPFLTGCRLPPACESSKEAPDNMISGSMHQKPDS